MTGEFVPANAVVTILSMFGSVGAAGYMFKRWMDTIEKKITDNKVEIKTTLDSLIMQVKTQNGNVAKVTEEIHLQVQACNLRNTGRKSSDKCGADDSEEDDRLNKAIALVKKLNSENIAMSKRLGDRNV